MNLTLNEYFHIKMYCFMLAEYFHKNWAKHNVEKWEYTHKT
jgi:hypothetical protein